MVDVRALAKLGKGALRVLDDLGFYSKAAEEAGRAKQAMPPEQWDRYLAGRGVKRAEMDHAGFENETKGVSKLSPGDARDLFEAKKPKLTEHVGDYDGTDFEPKYGGRDHILPGGMGYNERLLSLPEKRDYAGHSVAYYHPDGALERPVFSDEKTANAFAENLPQMWPGSRLVRVDPVTYPDHAATFNSSHWDAPNVLAHLRMQERKLPDGRFATHLEEVQSDWAQQGRKKGFGDGVPTGPFVQDTSAWTDLALKRALTVAAQNESDAFALTPGKLQSGRWGGDQRIGKFYDTTVQPKLTKMLGQPEMTTAAQLPTFSLPEELRDRILREGFPLFADGGLVENYARGGPVDDSDVVPLAQRLHEPDDDLIDILMNQQAMRRQGQIPPVEWGGDLSGARKTLKKADGGFLEDDSERDSDENHPILTDEQLQQALDLLFRMQQGREDEF